MPNVVILGSLLHACLDVYIVGLFKFRCLIINPSICDGFLEMENQGPSSPPRIGHAGSRVASPSF